MYLAIVTFWRRLRVLTVISCIYTTVLFSEMLGINRFSLSGRCDAGPTISVNRMLSLNMVTKVALQNSKNTLGELFDGLKFKHIR